MLRHLDIRNVVLVERLELDFEPGLGVLTGETGAGKSMLIDALSLLLGDRSDADCIRAGADEATLEAIFHKNSRLAEALEAAGALRSVPEASGAGSSVPSS